MKNNFAFKNIILAAALVVAAAFPFQGFANPAVPTPIVSFPSTITAANASSVVFSVSGEAGATFNYAIGSITGSTLIAADGTATFTLDLSSLADGAITGTFTITDMTGTSDPASLMATKNTAAAPAPAQPSVSAPSSISNANASNFPYAISAEANSTLNYSITNSAAATSTPVAGTLAIPASGNAILTVNLSALPDGFITGTFSVTDANGTSQNALTLTSKSTTSSPAAPAQPNVSAPSSITSANAASFPYTVSAEAGSTLHYSITNSAVATSTPVVGTAVIASNGTATVNADLSGLSDGLISGTFYVTNANGTSPSALTLTSKSTSGSGNGGGGGGMGSFTPQPIVSAPSTITSANVAAFPYSVTAEPNATLHYSITNSAVATSTPVTGTVVIPASGTTTVAANLTNLANGMISGTFYVTDSAGSSANSQTLTTKNVVGTPATPQPSVSAPSSITNANEANFPYTITGEAGATLHYSITNSAVATSTPVTGTAVIPANGTISPLSVNVSGLPNGMISGTFYVTDANGTSPSAQTLTAKSTTGAAISNPVITITGSSTVSIALNAAYADAGATAVASDGHTDISSRITSTSTVNVAVAGSYSVTYHVVDPVTNAAASAVRTVNVSASGTGGNGGGGTGGNGGGGSGGSGGIGGGGGSAIGGGGNGGSISFGPNSGGNGSGGSVLGTSTSTSSTGSTAASGSGSSIGGGKGNPSYGNTGSGSSIGTGAGSLGATSSGMTDASSTQAAAAFAAAGSLGANWFWILFLILLLILGYCVFSLRPRNNQ